MDQLLKLKDSLMGYLSPAAMRRQTMLPATPSEKATAMQRPTRPTTEPRNPKQKAVAAGRVNKKYLSPSDTRRTFGKQRKRKYSDDEYVDEDEDQLDSATRKSQS